MVFLIVSIILFNLFAIIVPKRLSQIEMYATCLFMTILQILVDVFLDLKYHLYGYFVPGVDWDTMLIVFGIFPALNILFLNYYPYGKIAFHKILYIGAWTILSLLFEYGSLKNGIFYYTQWKLWYSALLYPIIFFILAWDLSFIRHLKPPSK